MLPPRLAEIPAPIVARFLEASPPSGFTRLFSTFFKAQNQLVFLYSQGCDTKQAPPVLNHQMIADVSIQGHGESEEAVTYLAWFVIHAAMCL